MLDFAEARRRMVDNQIRTADVTHRALLAAFDALPREAFLPGAAKPFAYTDQCLELALCVETGERRFALPPALLARMIQAVEPVHMEKVLVVGCGTGYSCAVFAALGARVIGLDEDAEMIASAQAAMAAQSIAGVTMQVGSLRDGVPAQAPFDVIFIEGAYGELPKSYFDQLAENGRLIAVHGVGRAGEVVVFVKSDGVIGNRTVFDASAPLLGALAKAPAFTF